MNNYDKERVVGRGACGWALWNSLVQTTSSLVALLYDDDKYDKYDKICSRKLIGMLPF